MLHEIQETRQIPDEGFRRWFTDERLDLIVWYSHKDGRISGFQLCYDKDKDEKALTWKVDEGFLHEQVDTGEEKGYSHKGTPILIPDGVFQKNRAVKEFTEASVELDPAVRGFVIDILEQYNGLDSM